MQLNVRDAARLLQVSERTVYRWIREGSIPCVKVDDQHRFHKVELLEWAQRHDLAVAPEAFAGGPAHQDSASIADAIAAGGVHHDVPGKDVETVLREVTARLRLDDESDREALLAVYLAREAKATTAIGGGIAIPHVRGPVVLHVRRPQICVCFLREPADLHAPDHQLVHTVMALVSPSVRVHLQTLARLAALLKMAEALKELLAKHPPAEALVARVRALEAKLPDRRSASGGDGMGLLIASLIALLGTGLVALALARAPRVALAVGAAGAVAGALGLLAVAAAGLHEGSVPQALDLPLAVPGGALALRLDGLSAFFLLLLAMLALPAAPFGAAYLLAHGAGRRRLAVAACAFNVLVAAMAVVVTAHNAVLFLIAWEVMTIASFLLVVFDHEHAEVRAAGTLYLIASQLAGACLLAMFAVLGTAGPTLDFAGFRAALSGFDAPKTALVLALALLGFGTKMGIAPLHVWLPEAHPAAPSHVSALMSGVMIKMGVYGLLRTLSWCERVPQWFGALLLGLGAATAVLGILWALGQRDLKRALAYSSIENMGIVAAGIGITALAAREGHAALASLALHGALLHCLCHTLFKGSLFLCAGTILDATGTRDVERLGGLLGRMRAAGTAFLAGAAGICALPSLASFAGEGSILAAGLGCAQALPTWAAILTALAVLMLALAGGLALAAFTRLSGLVLLGQPRSEQATRARSRASLAVPAAALAACGLLAGLCPGVTTALPGPAAATVAASWQGAQPLVDPQLLGRLARASALLAAVLLGCALLRSLLPRAGKSPRVATWGCGYAQPSERMQYTGTSFAQPLVATFEAVLAPERQSEGPEGPFPQRVARSTRVPDRVERRLVLPLFAAVGRRLATVRRLQHGNLQRYLLQIVVVLGLGLAWMLVSQLLAKP